MKQTLLLVFLFSMMLITGCGHNIVCNDKGTGILFRVPLPDGNSLFELKLGNIESSRAIIRGNSTYDILTSTGGQFISSAGTTSRILLTSNIQLNEGNIKNILTSPNLSDQAKIMLINFLTSQKAPNTTPMTIKSVGTAGSTEKDSLKVEAIKDALVQKTSDTINNITPVLAQGTIKTTSKITNSLENTAKTVQINYQLQRLITNIIIILALLIIFLVLLTFILKAFKVI